MVFDPPAINQTMLMDEKGQAVPYWQIDSDYYVPVARFPAVEMALAQYRRDLPFKEDVSNGLRPSG